MLGQVKVPTPFTDVVVHFSGMCPQFKRQFISGTGMPIAVQVIVKVSPTDSITIGGGGVWM